MRVLSLVVLALVAIATATPVLDVDDHDELLTNKTFVTKDILVRQKFILKLLNHITQKTIYKDIEDVARDYKLKENVDKYMKSDAVKDFVRLYEKGMLPRGEIFCLMCEKQMKEVIRVFHVLFYAKDFDTFLRTACWMRERINEGMFVYALTVAVLHREDCRGITLPTPYEIYPYFFVNADVIQKAYMIKMKRGLLDEKLLTYYGIRLTEDNVFIIDTKDKDLRVNMNKVDTLNYFTEDIDLNTYYYYFHVDYPMWMGSDVFGTNKDRRGELYYFMHQQLLARYNLERLSHKMCDVKMLSWNLKVKDGYWPMLRHHNGLDLPLRFNDHTILNDNNVHLMTLVKDYETRIRQAIIKGYVTMHDGTRIDLRKPEDIEMLGRLIHGNLDKKDVLFYRYLELFCKTLLGVDFQMIDKYRATPTVIEQYETALRDPLFWQLQTRIIDNFIVFKKLLPIYTREELDFPGVIIEKIETDKLVTFFDEDYMDITNVVMLDNEEVKKQKEDMIFKARMMRLNHQPFTLTMDVVSDKTVDSVVRIFLGPKEDCMGNERNLDDRRLDFVEIDTFLYKLKTGNNIIKRESTAMHNIIKNRLPSRKLFNTKLSDYDTMQTIDLTNYWYKSRIGFPYRLLLPKGHKGGLKMQLYVILTPVRMGKTLNVLDLDMMKEKKVCRSSVCFDTMPLGFPLDRRIDLTTFFTRNMKFLDVLIFHKNLDDLNKVRDRLYDDKTYMTELRKENVVTDLYQNDN